MDLSARAANEDSWCGSSPQNNPFVLFCFLENLNIRSHIYSNIATLKVGGMEHCRTMWKRRAKLTQALGHNWSSNIKN